MTPCHTISPLPPDFPKRVAHRNCIPSCKKETGFSHFRQKITWYFTLWYTDSVSVFLPVFLCCNNFINRAPRDIMTPCHNISGDVKVLGRLFQKAGNICLRNPPCCPVVQRCGIAEGFALPCVKIGWRNLPHQENPLACQSCQWAGRWIPKAPLHG